MWILGVYMLGILFYFHLITVINLVASVQGSVSLIMMEIVSIESATLCSRFYLMNWRRLKLKIGEDISWNSWLLNWNWKRKLNWSRVPSFFCVWLLFVSTKSTIPARGLGYVVKRNYKRTSLVFSSDAILCLPTGNFKLECRTLWKWDSCSHYFRDTEIRG